MQSCAKSSMLEMTVTVDQFHTFVPVSQSGHYIESNGLVGALLQYSSRQTLICSLES